MWKYMCMCTHIHITYTLYTYTHNTYCIHTYISLIFGSPSKIPVVTGCRSQLLIFMTRLLCHQELLNLSLITVTSMPPSELVKAKIKDREVPWCNLSLVRHEIAGICYIHNPFCNRLISESCKRSFLHLNLVPSDKGHRELGSKFNLICVTEKVWTDREERKKIPPIHIPYDEG